jgi:hypothetical protein
MLQACGLDPRTRPEELSLEAFARVTDALLAAGTPLPDAKRPSPRKRPRA